MADTLNNENNVALSRWTAALYAMHKFSEPFDHCFKVDAAYQFGTMGHPAGQADIAAYMIAGDWAVRLVEKNKAWVGLGFQIMSGDDFGNPDEVNWFYNNYASKHTILGHMDYFKSDTGEKALGIRDLIVRTGIAPFKNLLCKLDLHRFSVQEAFISLDDGSDAHLLGYEIDTNFKYQIHAGLRAELGIDFFIPSKDWQGPESDVSTFQYLVLSATL